MCIKDPWTKTMQRGRIECAGVGVGKAGVSMRGKWRQL